MSGLDDLRIDLPLPKPRRKRQSPWLAVVVLLCVLAALAWWQRAQLGARISPLLQAAAPVRSVKVFSVPQATSAPGSFSAGGYLEVIPPGPLVASALVAGRVAEVLVTAGEPVKRGQLIARLDSALYAQQASVLKTRVELARRQLELKQAGSRSEEIDTAQADYDRAAARLAQAEAAYKRSEELFAKDVIARQELEARQAEWQQAQAESAAQAAQLNLAQAGARKEELAIAEAEVDAAQADLARLQFDIAQCEIRAPAAGVVYELLVAPGAWLTPAADNPLAAAAATLFEPGQIQAWADISQRDSAQLFIGQRVELTTDAQPQRKIAGTVKLVAPRANMQKNTLQVKIAIPEPPEDLRPEMSVKLQFLPADDPQAEEAAQPAGVLVPAGAVLERDGSRGVFVIENGTARWRQVETGATAGDQLEVLSGVSPGDQLILDPQAVSDGQPVQPETAEEQS